MSKAKEVATKLWAAGVDVCETGDRFRVVGREKARQIVRRAGVELGEVMGAETLTDRFAIQQHPEGCVIVSDRHKRGE